MRRGAVSILVAAAGLVLAAPSAAQGAAPERATDARHALSAAQTALVFGERREAVREVAIARNSLRKALSGVPELSTVLVQLAEAERAAAAGDDVRLAAARSAAWTTVLRASLRRAVAAAAAGRVSEARSWLLVREFRPPTRFTRAAADATLALDGLAAGRIAPAAAAAAVRADLLDTYDSRLRSALASLQEAADLGFVLRRAEADALASGYWTMLAPTYRRQRGTAAAGRLTAAFERIGTQSSGGALTTVERALAGFHAAPLSRDELIRRAGQLDRFLRLVPIEYARGVDDGRVTVAFEIQEAVSFRDAADAAFRDLEPVLLGRDTAATRRLGSALSALDDALADAAGGGAVADPDQVRARTDRALSGISTLYPPGWKDAAETADFDVIAAALDRMQAATAAGEWGRAEQARLEAYGIFELGPEQHLRGLAPGLFQEIEGYFWYGAKGEAGLVQLLKRKAALVELQSTRNALDGALGEAEARIGSGPQSGLSVVANSAVIVFREGLEAVLILAALTASMVGARRRYRRPLLAGAALALVASAATWVVAQTVLTSLAVMAEKLEAIVSLAAIAVLLVILNWFYHRVYWQENLQDLHRRKKRILTGVGLSLATAQIVGLAALGFSSVYREGFETVLFLQALSLEAGPATVLYGVTLGLVATIAVGVAVVRLERKLPHKKMLVATGILITWVLVVMVGTTVQTMQKVGWLDVSPIDGLELPYWAGLWLGLYPTWQGVLAQASAAGFVVGSYVLAEGIRARRRARIVRDLARGGHTTAPARAQEPASASSPQ